MTNEIDCIHAFEDVPLHPSPDYQPGDGPTVCEFGGGDCVCCSGGKCLNYEREKV